MIGRLAAWGERWIEVTTERSDPGFALWAWCQVQLDRAALPPGRVVVALIFPDERPTNRRYWLLIEGGDAEVCYSDPGGEPDLMVEAGSLAFVDWHRGARSWATCCDRVTSGCPDRPGCGGRFRHGTRISTQPRVIARTASRGAIPMGRR